MQPFVVEAGGSRHHLDDLDPAHLAIEVAAHGAVALRGFGADTAALDRVSDRCCDRFTCDPGKVVVGGLRGRGDAVGRAARAGARAAARIRHRAADGARARFAPFAGFGINPHTENGFLPDAMPEVVWFVCDTPASDGGESLLSDGVATLDRLDAETREWLRSTPVRYDSRLSASQWRSVWGEPELDELTARLRTVDGASILDDRSDELAIRFDTVQVRTTRFGGREAVATNLLSRHPYGAIGRDHHERLTDGSQVDREILERLLAATDPGAVHLEAGDVLVIDNTRVMHGRTPFTDTSRRVATRCGWWRADVAPV